MAEEFPATTITEEKVDIRKDPFTEADESVLKEKEEYTIPAASKFYIKLKEIPRKDDPSSVFIYPTSVLAEDLDISETLVDVVDGSLHEVDEIWLIDEGTANEEQVLVTGKATNTLTVERGYGTTDPHTHSTGTRFRRLTSWTEVYTAPSAGEYQVHYGTESVPYRKGLIRFHEDEAGKVVWVDYYGTGCGNIAEHINDIQDELAVINADGWATRIRLQPHTAGNHLIGSADTVQSTTDDGYTKVKEIVIGRAGTLRIKFDLKTSNSGAYAYGRVYRNGVAAGPTQSTNSESYQTKSQDISGWSPGDLCQLYIKIETPIYVTASARNFRIYTGVPLEIGISID